MASEKLHLNEDISFTWYKQLTRALSYEFQLNSVNSNFPKQKGPKCDKDNKYLSHNNIIWGVIKLQFKS